MLENNKEIFELKDKRTYPKILNDEIKLLSFNEHDSTLIGSASYKIQKYPADIDLYEQIHVCCSKDFAIEYFYLGIKDIVNNIRYKQNHWVIEVKCGIDFRYDIKDDSELELLLLKAKNEKLFSDSDYNKLLELFFNKNRTKLDKELTEEILRKYKIIRWTADQIELGKQVRFGKNFYLKDCIDTYSPINIEIIAVIDNKFTDLSNFYVLMFYDKLTGKDVLINFPQDYIKDGKKFVKEGLKQGINKVLFSILNKDVFKGIKRMYSLSRLTNDKKLFNKIKYLISSPLAELSQLKSEFATLYEIIDFTDNLPWNVVFLQLQSIKWRLGGNMMLEDYQLEFFIDNIDTMINNKNDIVFLKDSILDCKIKLLEIVNNKSEKQLKKIGLYKYF